MKTKATPMIITLRGDEQLLLSEGSLIDETEQHRTQERLMLCTRTCRVDLPRPPLNLGSVHDGGWLKLGTSVL